VTFQQKSATFHEKSSTFHQNNPTFRAHFSQTPHYRDIAFCHQMCVFARMYERECVCACVCAHVCVGMSTLFRVHFSQNLLSAPVSCGVLQCTAVSYCVLQCVPLAPRTTKKSHSVTTRTRACVRVRVSKYVCVHVRVRVCVGVCGYTLECACHHLKS